MKRRRSWGLDAMVSYQLMKRLGKAGSWESLRSLTGEIRAPYIGLEGAREVTAFFEASVPRFSKLAKKGGGAWDVSELAWMQVGLVDLDILCHHLNPFFIFLFCSLDARPSRCSSSAFIARSTIPRFGARTRGSLPCASHSGS